MRWLQTEFLLKGVYLGLLFAVGLQRPNTPQTVQVGVFMAGGLALCLGVAAFLKWREGYRVRGRLAGFILFLLLDNPVLVYVGILIGLAAGAYSIFDTDKTGPLILIGPAAGGAILGFLFWQMRYVHDTRIRQWLGLTLAVVLVGGAIALLQVEPELFHGAQRTMAGWLLLGIPGFYLMTFAGLAEESEIEIAAICAALGVSVWILGEGASESLGWSPTIRSLGLAVPIAVYFVYSRKIMPGLRVFKHILRGISYGKVGRHRFALLSLRRALALDPRNQLAQESLWRAHREIDFSKLADDRETLAVVDFELCLQRVSQLLLLPHPRTEQVHESHRLLGLVESQRPELAARCRYWRAVAYTHEGKYEDAAAALESVLEEPAQDTPGRRAVLLPAWQLALTLHPELKRRVGVPMLGHPARRIEAIAAVERQLAVKPDDAAAWDLKRQLYSELIENDYRAVAGPSQALADFDHEYVHQLGLALLDDRERWQRGCEYLRMAATGLPLKAPSLYITMAKVHERLGDPSGMWNEYERAMHAGRSAQPQNLSEEDRQTLFGVVKQLGDHARPAGDIDKALECYKFLSQFERAGIDTWRTLAELFEQRKDVWLALHCTEHALSYDEKDKDLLERKDRYYYSITAGELRERLENVYKWFDVEYCKQKARWLLERINGDLDRLDWAGHLADLAQAYDRTSLSARVLRARVQRLRGEIDQSAATLEEVRSNKPEKFANADEEESWFVAHRLLGELYVDDKPDQAVLCFQEFRKSPRSGANTLYNLGRAYENLGDRARAMRAYEQVMAFEGNPLVYEAQDALSRLRGAESGSLS